MAVGAGREGIPEGGPLKDNRAHHAHKRIGGMDTTMFKEYIDKDGLPEPEPANASFFTEKERAALTAEKRGFCGFCGTVFWGHEAICSECYERTMLL